MDPRPPSSPPQPFEAYRLAGLAVKIQSGRFVQMPMTGMSSSPQHPPWDSPFPNWCIFIALYLNTGSYIVFIRPEAPKDIGGGGGEHYEH